MSSPTEMFLHHLKKFLGLKGTVDYYYVKKGGGYWCLETLFLRGFHGLNRCPLFNSSRTQKVVSLSSCEAELHTMVSATSDGIHRFFKCKTICCKERCWKSETL